MSFVLCLIEVRQVSSTCHREEEFQTVECHEENPDAEHSQHDVKWKGSPSRLEEAE